MIAGLLLAAGGARRFGSQKLVATVDGVPLVRRAHDTLAEVVDSVFVVVGAEAPAVTHALESTDATIIVNPDWADGLSTSIRRGIGAVPLDAEAVIVALGDEPEVDARIAVELIAMWKNSGRPIVAARYEGVQSHPVLFDRSVFPELSVLEGDVGAKSVIYRSAERVAFVDVASARPIDVDVPADLRRLGKPTGEE
jgi:molybdenum cofactor cytidylyltransferase